MFKRFAALIFILLNLAPAPVTAQPACDPDADSINLVVTADGLPLNVDDRALAFDISANGSEVVFSSEASNWVANDTNNYPDVFLYRRHTCQLARVSVNSRGQQGNHNSQFPSISADGRYIAFSTNATNLVEPDDNGAASDILVRDLQTGTLTRESVSSSTAQGNAFSFGGYFSADNRYLFFGSTANNLVVSDSNDEMDVFRRDLQTGKTELVSLRSNETQFAGPASLTSIATAGRYVVFISTREDSGVLDPIWDVWRRDLQTGKTTLVSVDPNGVPLDEIVSYETGISANGRYVVFHTPADDATHDNAPGLSDVFVRDMTAGQTTLITRGYDGSPANSYSYIPYISALSDDGRIIVFYSNASNLVEGDTNGHEDVFWHDRLTGQTTLIPKSSYGASGNYIPIYIGVSPDGRYVVVWTGIPPTGTEDQLYLVRLPPLPDDAPFINVYDTLTPTLTWGAITWAAGYEVQVADNPDFDAPACCIGLITDLSVQTTPLTEDVIYYWRVRAVDGNDEHGVWSHIEEFIIALP